MATGVRQVHGRRCTGRKDCGCPWQAFVYSTREKKKIRRQFPTQAAAKSWRADASGLVAKRLMRAPTAITLKQAWETWYEDAQAGRVLTRAGDPYKPSAVRSYEAAMRLRVLPELGHERLGNIARSDLQRFVNGLLADGLAPATIMVTVLPLRALYKHAVELGDVAINPTTGLRMPAVRGGRDRIAAPDECLRLLAALRASDRPLWATAMYAGLRRGELAALRVEDVDLASGVIHVRRGWDAKVGEIATKSGKERRVPITAVLRDHLDEHLLGLAWRSRADGLVFGTGERSAFTGTAVLRRGRRAFETAGLKPIGLHECRHTFASLMIAAGVNAKALSSYLGHASIQITFDRYGHLMPGNEGEAADLLDAFLARAAEGATGTNPGTSTPERVENPHV